MFFRHLVVHNENEIPEGYKRGMPSKYYGSSTCIDTVWISNRITNEQKRIPKNDPIPEGWINIRIKGPGFSLINSANKTKFINLKTKKYEFIDKNKIKNHHYKFDGHKIDDIKCYIHNNNIILGDSNLKKYLAEHCIDVPIKCFKNIDDILPKPHHNHACGVKQFLEKQKGKTLKDLGFEKIFLNELLYSEKYNLFL